MDRCLKHLRSVTITALLLAVVGSAGASTWLQFFGPVTGILKGTANSPQTTAATAADVVGLFSACSGTQYLGADGACHNGGGAGSGTVTSVSVVSANGLSGTVATSTTTPAITLVPTFTGIAHSTGSGFAAAVAADFPTLNQSTSGNAATATALAALPSQCSGSQFATGIAANGTANCATPTGSGNVSNTGTPTSGQAAEWISSTVIQGVAVTGTGSYVKNISPSLTTPNIGSATASSINGDTITAGSWAINGDAGKTFAFTNSVTLSGTDSTIMTFPALSGVVVTLNQPQTFIASKVFTNSELLLLGSSTGATTFTSDNASATNYTVHVPAANDTLVELAAAQTLTNKSISSSQITGLASSATIDTTNASNISTGTLANARLNSTLTSNTSGNAATATALASAPSQCSGGQFATGVAASGNANCSTPPGAALMSYGLIEWNGSSCTIASSAASANVASCAHGGTGALTVTLTSSYTKFAICNATWATNGPGDYVYGAGLNGSFTQIGIYGNVASTPSDAPLAFVNIFCIGS